MLMEFCEHLDDYGVRYVRADAAYRALLAQIERVAAGAADDDALDLLERMLHDWQDEVKVLRKKLVVLVKEGQVELPEVEEDEASSGPACCADCGAQVPRLVFNDFRVEADSATFRGRALPRPATAGV